MWRVILEYKSVFPSFLFFAEIKMKYAKRYFNLIYWLWLELNEIGKKLFFIEFLCGRYPFFPNLIWKWRAQLVNQKHFCIFFRLSKLINWPMSNGLAIINQLSSSIGLLSWNISIRVWCLRSKLMGFGLIFRVSVFGGSVSTF